MSTTQFRNNIIEVKAPNAGSDWSLANVNSQPDLTQLEPGVPIHSILYTPGASLDVVVVKDGNDSGPIIAKFESADATNQRIKYFYGKRHKPYVDISEGTYGKKTISIMTIELE